MIPLSIPNFAGNEKKYVDEALEQGWVSTGGAYINELENKLSEYLGAPMVAACQSGTSAIHMALVDCNVMPGDAVIVPTVTFIAAVNPVKYQFANPIFIDCDDSLCIDPVKIKKYCEEECDFISGKLIRKSDKSHVKAIVVVHVFGNMCDMESIMDIAQEYNLKVIEDSTEALGTRYTTGRYSGKFAGTIGDYGAYSFNGNKIITTGGGGAVTARDKKAVEHIKYLSTQAKDDPHYYIHDEVGYNYRMTNLQAALGVAQLELLPKFIERKHSAYAYYKELFEGYDKAVLCDFREGTDSNMWFYSLLIDRDKVKASMREIITALEEKGVGTRAIWGLIHQQKPYLECEAYMMEKAPYYAQRILNIPCSTQITDEEIRTVATAVKEVLDSFGV